MSNTAALSSKIETIVNRFPSDIQPPMRELTEWMFEEFHVSHHDFSELKDSVQRLTTIQEMTEHRMHGLTDKVEKLAEAQDRTERRMNDLTDKVEKLAEAQDRTERRMNDLTDKVEKLAEAQDRTEQKVEQLAEAQQRTEQKVEQLAEAQQRTEHAIHELRQSLSDQISALGSRWGIYNEGTFRSTIYGIFEVMEGITVKEGYYGGRQVDVVIRNGEHILLEITSRMHAKDIDKMYRSADDYERQEGVTPKMMVATSYVSPKLMQKIMGLARPIDIFSYEGEE